MNNRVILVDDHPAMRMVVRCLLENEGFDVISETDNGSDALLLVKQLHPDILILDIGIPLIDGLTVIHRLQALNLPVKIIVLTGQESEHLAMRCMKFGAHGFVNKKNELDSLVNAIRTIDAGYNLYPHRATHPGRRENFSDSDDKLLATLSSRELWVLQKLSQGMTNKKIAEDMMLSTKTISTYKTRILTKLNARNLLDLFELAKRNGLTV